MNVNLTLGNLKKAKVKSGAYIILVIAIISLVSLEQILSVLGPGRNVRGGNSLVSEKVNLVARDKPDIVFMGTSVCQEGVDEEIMSDLLGVSAKKYCGHIQRTAYYYLFFKNVLLSDELVKAPKVIIILFVYGGLTESRTSLNYGEEFYINTLTVEDDDKLVNEIIYQSSTNYLARMFSKYSFVVRKREIYHRYILDKAFELLGLSTVTMVQSGKNIANKYFVPERMIPSLYALEVEKVVETLEADDQLTTFDAHVERTFLPKLVELARKNSIELVYVHMPVNRGVDHNRNNLNNSIYIRDLRSYANRYGHMVLDYSDSELFTLKDFPPGDTVHLNALGRKKFAVEISKRLQVLEDL